jgi:hypothetical protein
MGEINGYKVFRGKGEDYLEDLSVDGRLTVTVLEEANYGESNLIHLSQYRRP